MQSSLLLATPRLCSSVAWATVPFRRARAIVSVGVRTSSRSNRPPYSTTRFSTNTGSKTAGSNSPASGPGADANDDPLSAPQDQRILHVAVAGLPNAGKSTLVNLMVGDKVSAVSSKRHTTRRNAMGIMTLGNAQVFFHDTPGFISHVDQGDYRRELSKAAKETVALVDVTLLVIDASKKMDERIFVSTVGLLERALRSQGGLAIVLNKVDLVHPRARLVEKKDQIMDLTQKIADGVNAGKTERSEDPAEGNATPAGSEGGEDGVKAHYEKVNRTFEEVMASLKRDSRAERPVDRHVKVFMTSATDGHGVEGIIEMLERSARPGRWRFDRETTTNLDEGRRATEIVRESLFVHLYKELPYVIEQQTKKFIRHKDNTVFLEQDLLLDRESQKGIVVGQLRVIHKDVIAKLTKLFGAKVTVHFNVVAGKKRMAA